MTIDIEAAHVVLRDGARVLVRPIRPHDRGRLVRGFSELSDRSRYLRFHTAIDELSDEQLRYLTEVDGVDHVAFVGIALDEERQPGVGVARFVRLEDDPTAAEAAITVVDRWQGRGLGTVLLGILGRAARDRGIERFDTYVLADNTAMLELLDQLGARRGETSDAVVTVEVPIGDLPDEVQHTPAAQVLRAAARGRLRLLLSPLVPIRVPDLSRAARTGRQPGSERPMLRAWLDEKLGSEGGDG